METPMVVTADRALELARSFCNSFGVTVEIPYEADDPHHANLFLTRFLEEAVLGSARRLLQDIVGGCIVYNSNGQTKIPLAVTRSLPDDDFDPSTAGQRLDEILRGAYRVSDYLREGDAEFGGFFMAQAKAGVLHFTHGPSLWHPRILPAYGKAMDGKFDLTGEPHAYNGKSLSSISR